MKRMIKVQMIGLCMMLTLLACSNAMQLAYTKPPAADFSRGDIAVVLDDRRVPPRDESTEEEDENGKGAKDA